MLKNGLVADLINLACPTGELGTEDDLKLDQKYLTLNNNICTIIVQDCHKELSSEHISSYRNKTPARIITTIIYDLYRFSFN